MTVARKKWLMGLVKFAVCAGALWYLSGKLSINDYVRLQDDPQQRLRLVEESEDSLSVLDAGTGELRHVPRSALARAEQLGKNQRPIEYGLRYVLHSVDWSWMWWAFVANGPAVFLMAWRLRLLLTTQQIHIPLRDAVWLTFAGNFFNFSMPGTTGGDLYKAYHIAKRTHKRAEGVTIVFLDRVIGLISFLLLAAAAIFASWGKDMIGVYGRWVGYLLVALIIAFCLFFSRRIRQLIRYERLLQRLPFADKLRRVDETAFNFRYHPRETLLALFGTIVLHVVVGLSLYFLALGLGIRPGPDRSHADLFLASLLCFVVGYLFAAVPISVQGFGILEAVFIRVLVAGEWCSMNQMIAMSLGIRVVQIAWSLPGVFVPWLGFKMPPHETAAVAARSAGRDAASTS